MGSRGAKTACSFCGCFAKGFDAVPISYELIAVHVDPGFDGESADRLEAFFKQEGFRYEIIRTDHGPRAHGPENRENPCFLCARLRRSVLFSKARELGCPKIALGHNQDDIIETFFMNICYGAQVAGMMPRQEFFGGEITLIRPFALVPAQSILRVCKNLGLPIGADKLSFGCEKPKDGNPQYARWPFQEKFQGSGKYLPCNEQHQPRIPAKGTSGQGEAGLAQRAADVVTAKTRLS